MAPLNFKIKPPQITLPVLALLLSAFLILAGIIGMTVSQMDEQDEVAKNHQIQLVLEAELQRITNGVKAYANWDDTVRNYFGKYDAEWIVKNFDNIVLDEQKIDHFYVYDEHDQLVHRYPDLDEHQELLKHIQSLFPKFREISEKDAGYTPSGLYVDPDFGVFLVSMRRITAVDEKIPDNIQHGILVFIDELIGDQLTAITKRMGVDRISPSPLPGTDNFTVKHQIPLTGMMGENNGYLNWQAQPPSATFVRQAALPLGIGLFVIICLAAVILHREQTAIHNMVRTEATIQLLAAAVDASRTPIVILIRDNHEFVITYANPSFLKLSGYDAEILEGKPISFLEAKETAAVHAELIQKYISESAAGKLEILHQRANGTTFWNEVILSPIISDARRTEGFIAVMRDMTEERRNREAKAQRDRTLSLGQMAGSVAHELNNLLQPAMTYSELLGGREQYQDAISQEALKYITESCKSATQIIGNVLSFSRQGENDLRAMPLGDAIKRALDMVRPLVPSTLMIRVGDMNKVNLPANINDTQMTQLLSQLLMNASWATEKRGSIGINLRHIKDQDAVEIATRHSLTPANFADLTVADNGIGMDAETLRRALEPFFTTHDVGQGTGLGLSMVDGIAKSWGGAVELQSEKNKGTVVHVYIPLLAA